MEFLLVSVAQKYEAHHQEERRGSPSGYQLVILNMLGQEVARLVEGWQRAGRYQVNWRSGGHPSGVYFCRLRAGEFVQTRKMNLLH